MAKKINIKTLDDIRALASLDERRWAVLSCPTTGLEVPDEFLALLDTNGDGRIRTHEVIATANRLLSELKNPERMLSADMSAVDAEIAELDAQIAAAKVEVKPAPEAPYAADVISAWHAAKDANDAYFHDVEMQKLGLVKANEEAAPICSAEQWAEMSAKISAYEAEVAAVAAANDAALTAAAGPLREARKLLLLERWFVTLLRNYVTFEQFFHKREQAVFQCGRLYIDSRMTDLCVRVADAAKMGADAGKSGLFLLFLTCENKTSGKKMDIIAGMTAGEVNNLFVGKNAIFYDRDGLDYDATVTKIIDNPISVAQAFWTPYRKLANWVSDLVNKSIAEKESKSFEGLKDGTTKAVDAPKQEAAPAFDIAKFAGIFAALGMALGAIGTAVTALATGIASLLWWQVLVAIAGVLLCISGPSMLLAAIKIHKRNLAPVLNANGWAINAEVFVRRRR